jgi:hypothetical protein
MQHKQQLPPRNSPPLNIVCPRKVRIVCSLAYNHARLPLSIILVEWGAETQYALLMLYYKRCGVWQSPTSHQYRGLRQDEENEIVRLRMAGASKLAIADKLGRHVSTIFYACKRLHV